jgi:hypothetical protein
MTASPAGTCRTKQEGIETAAASEPSCRKEQVGPPETRGVGQPTALEAIMHLVARLRAALRRGDERGVRDALDSLADLVSRLRGQQER